MLKYKSLLLKHLRLYYFTWPNFNVFNRARDMEHKTDLKTACVTELLLPNSQSKYPSFSMQQSVLLPPSKFFLDLNNTEFYAQDDFFNDHKNYFFLLAIKFLPEENFSY